MSRYLLVIAALALICSPALALEIDESGDDNGGKIDVTLDIAEYAQVVWGQTQDMKIEFGSPDWYWDGPNVQGSAYKLAPDTATNWWLKVANDPWAGDLANGSNPDGTYYESGQQADIYVKANSNIDMTVTDNGPLTSGSNTIDTWFTLCAAAPGGALIGGIIRNNSTGQPGDPGTYFDESGASLVPGGAYPTQDAIPLDGVSNSWNVDLDAPLLCTLTFHVRCHRQGLNDAAGNYTTTIGVGFAPSP
jgi:hypothetical protein